MVPEKLNKENIAPAPNNYVKKVYENLLDAYGSNNVPNFEIFSQKIKDPKYRFSVHENLKDAFGINNLPNFKAFNDSLDVIIPQKKNLVETGGIPSENLSQGPSISDSQRNQLLTFLNSTGKPKGKTVSPTVAKVSTDVSKDGKVLKKSDDEFDSKTKLQFPTTILGKPQGYFLKDKKMWENINADVAKKEKERKGAKDLEDFINALNQKKYGKFSINQNDPLVGEYKKAAGIPENSIVLDVRGFNDFKRDFNTRKIKEEAIINTLNRREKDARFRSGPYGYTPDLNKRKSDSLNLAYGLDNDDYVVTQDRRTGENIIGVARYNPIFAFGDVYSQSKRDEWDNDYFEGLSSQDKVKYKEAQAELASRDTEMPFVPSGFAGGLGGAGGGLVNMIEKPLIYGTAAATTATVAAPAIVGAEALPFVIQGAKSFGNAVGWMYNTAKQSFTPTWDKVYEGNLKNIPNPTQEQKIAAADKATEAANYSKAVGVVEGGLFSVPFSKLGPTLKPAVNSYVNTLKEVYRNSKSQIPQMAGTSFVAEAGKGEIGAGYGSGEKQGEIFSNALNNAWETTKFIGGMGVLHAASAAVPHAFALLTNTKESPAKILTTKAKALVGKYPKEVVEEVYNKAEQEGVIPPGKAKEIIQDIDDYKKAESEVPSTVNNEDVKDSIAGLLQKRNLLTQEAKDTKIPDAKIEIEQKISELDKKISNIYKTGKVLENETDIADNPIIESEVTEVPVQEGSKPTELDKRISKLEGLISIDDATLAETGKSPLLKEARDAAKKELETLYAKKGGKPEGNLEVKPVTQTKESLENTLKDLATSGKKPSGEYLFNLIESIPDGTIIQHEGSDTRTVVKNKRISKTGHETYELIPEIYNEETGQWEENPSALTTLEKNKNGEYSGNVTEDFKQQAYTDKNGNRVTTLPKVTLPSEGAAKVEVKPTAETPVQEGGKPVTKQAIPTTEIPVEEGGKTTDIEIKKADIEKRRKEDLDKVDITKGGFIPIEGYEEYNKKINAKYDAELKALEGKKPTAEIPVEEGGKTTEFIPEVTVEGTKQGYQVLSGKKENAIGDIRQEASEARAAGKDSFTKETVKDGKKIFTLVDATASDDFGRPGFKSASITLPEGTKLTIEDVMPSLEAGLKGEKIEPIKIGEKAEVKPTEVGKTENTEKQEAINKANKQRQSTIEKTSREWQEANIDTEEHPLIVGDKLAEGVIIKVGQVLDYRENKDGKLLGKSVPEGGIPIVTSIEDLGNLHKQGMVDVGIFNSKEEANKWLADRDAGFKQSYENKLSKIDAKYAETATLEGGKEEVKPTEVKVTQDDIKKAEVKFTEAKAKYERARGKESKSIVDKLKDEAINAKSELDDIRNRVKVQEKVQPEVKPIEKEVFKSSQGHTVDIENGKLIVKDKKGEVLSDRASKKAIEEYAENFDYSKGEKAPEVPSEITNSRDAAKYVIEESNNPTEIAEIYASEDLLPKESNPKFQAIAEYGLGRIKTSSYADRFGDPNKIEKSMYLKIFSEERGLPIDVLAKSISDKYEGLNIEPQDIVDYIEKYSKGDKAVLEFKESDVALQAADKFNKLTGLDLNLDLANKVIDNKLGKANKNQLDIIKEEYETAKQLEDAYWAEYEKTDGFTKESNISEANKPETAKESQKKLEEAYKDLTNIEKRQIINSKFEELLKELKIEKICPTD